MDLAGLSYSNAFALSCNLDIRIDLSAYHDIVLNQFDGIVLTIILRRVSSELLRIENLIVFISSISSLLTMILRCLIYLITIMSIILDLQVAYLNDSFVIQAGIDAHAEVDSTTCICIL